MGTDAARFFHTIRRQSYSVLPTDSLVWNHLKPRQTSRIRFRRQEVVGSQLVDLYCPAAKLVVELDAPAAGSENAEYLTRLADIERTGAAVIRFSHGGLGHGPDEICDAIMHECNKRIERRRAG
jgi:very-short-patch-repair endonuclease